MSNAAAEHIGEEAGHHDHHDPRLAHHFDTPDQQFESGKLGIWIFLVQEVLFFSGLFCAYAVYRANHPEIFVYAHHYLDTNLGAINTVVLLFSSLTAAWSVRCAQLNQKKGLILTIVLTLICAFGFLGIKYVEYSHKIHDGLLWGNNFNPTHEVTSAGATAPVAKAGGATGTAEASAAGHGTVERPKNVHIFFGIYFAMTGLHGIHVIGGIVLYFWLLRRAIRGDFDSQFYGAIDYAALYWHLVDLVWIYLFPLLYLIH